MPKRPASNPPVALCLNGQLLLNVAAQLSPSALKKLASECGVAGIPFVGVPLEAGEKRALLAVLDDAPAEGSAKIIARRSASRSRR